MGLPGLIITTSEEPCKLMIKRNDCLQGHRKKFFLRKSTWQVNINQHLVNNSLSRISHILRASHPAQDDDTKSDDAAIEDTPGIF